MPHFDANGNEEILCQVGGHTFTGPSTWVDGVGNVCPRCPKPEPKPKVRPNPAPVVCVVDSRREDRDAAQTSVNYVKGLDPKGAMTADVVRAVAGVEHQEYPQYNGHWDEANGWVLVLVTRKVETKMGVAFEPGDVTLGKRAGFLGDGWTVYSIRNGCDTRLTFGVSRF